MTDHTPMPEKPEVEIVPFELKHQPMVDDLWLEIGKEFEEPIVTANTKPLKELSRLSNRYYWVALADNKVIGTIGIVFLKDNVGELKSFFVSKLFRGEDYEVSKKLFQTITFWAMAHNIVTIYLGTMNQFATAQAFYIKNGFTEITKNQLPHDYIINPVEELFYKKELAFE